MSRRITWQNIAAPDFSAALQAMGQVGENLGEAGEGLGRIGKDIADRQRRKISNEAMARAMGIGSVEELEALGDNPVGALGYDPRNMTAEAMEFFANQRAGLTDIARTENLMAQTSALTDRSRYDMNRARQEDELADANRGAVNDALGIISSQPGGVGALVENGLDGVDLPPEIRSNPAVVQALQKFRQDALSNNQSQIGTATRRDELQQKQLDRNERELIEREVSRGNYDEMLQNQTPQEIVAGLEPHLQNDTMLSALTARKANMGTSQKVLDAEASANRTDEISSFVNSLADGSATKAQAEQAIIAQGLPLAEEKLALDTLDGIDSRQWAVPAEVTEASYADPSFVNESVEGTLGSMSRAVTQALGTNDNLRYFERGTQLSESNGNPLIALAESQTGTGDANDEDGQWNSRGFIVDFGEELTKSSGLPRGVVAAIIEENMTQGGLLGFSGEDLKVRKKAVRDQIAALEGSKNFNQLDSQYREYERYDRRMETFDNQRERVQAEYAKAYMDQDLKAIGAARQKMQELNERIMAYRQKMPEGIKKILGLGADGKPLADDIPAPTRERGPNNLGPNAGQPGYTR